MPAALLKQGLGIIGRKMEKGITHANLRFTCADFWGCLRTCARPLPPPPCIQLHSAPCPKLQGGGGEGWVFAGPSLVCIV